MKKIISFLASVAMMVSVSATAFAAAPEGAVPVISVSTPVDVEGLYCADIDLSGLGTIHRTGSNALMYTATVINGFSVTLKSDVDIDLAAADDTSVLGTLSATVFEDLGNNTYKLSYAPTAVNTMYPNTLGASVTSIDRALGIMMIASSVPTLTVIEYKVSYVELKNGKAVAGSNESFYSVDVEKKYEGDNGYVWGVSFAIAGSLDSLTATFEDSNGNSQSAEATNVAAAAGFTGAGYFTFDIGLNTTKTITSATFDVVSGTGTTSYGSGTGTWN